MGGIQAMSFSPWGGWPIFLILAAAAIGLGWWSYARTPAPLTPTRRALLWMCRAAALILLLWVLARPAATLVDVDRQEPVVAVLVDVSGSMSLGDAAATRADRAAEAATTVGTDLARRFAVELRPFGAGLADPATDVTAFRPDSAQATALGDVLDQLQREPRSGPLAAVVLVSDGAGTSGRDLLSSARDLSVPVYGIAVGDSTSPADVQVIGVDVPPAAFVGESVPVRVRVRNVADRSAELRVRIVDDRGRPVGFADATVSGGGATQDLTITFTPDEPGQVFMRAEIDGDDLPNEHAFNDAMQFALTVQKDRLQVLVLEDHLSWDFSFLRRTFERDTTLSYTYLVSPDGTKTVPLGDVRTREFPASEADLREFKAVVLGDLDPKRLDDAQLERLARFVEAGGGLLMLGGNRAAGFSRWGGTPIARVAPIELSPPPRSGPGAPGSPPLRARVTVLGDAHPLTALHGDVYGNRNAWADLPPLRPSVATRSEATGAQVLVELGEAATMFPLVTVGRYGAGRVAAFGGRAVWQWKFVREGVVDDDAPFFDRFWVGMMRWLADPEPSARVRVRPQRLVFRQGQSADLAGRALTEDLAPLTDVAVHAMLVNESTGDSLLVEPTWGEGGDVAFRAGALPSGTYRYRVSFDSQPPIEESGVFRVDSAGPEWWELAARPNALRQAADASGGAMIDLANLGAAADSIPEPVLARSRTREALLWNHPLVLIAFLCFVAGEWWMRRRSGLA